MITEINCVKLYMQMNLTTPNEVTRAARPSLKSKSVLYDNHNLISNDNSKTNELKTL